MRPSPMAGLPVTVVRACLRNGDGGSPTAIVADAPWLGDDERRQVPVLAGVSHAVFIDTKVDEAEDGVLPIRFFTAEGELPACGHGTVAALAYLAERAGRQRYEARLLTLGGCSIRGRAERQGGTATVVFEAGRVGLREPTVEELAIVPPTLGLPARALSPGGCVAALGRPRMLLPVPNRSVLGEIRPDPAALQDACRRLGLLGCYVYCVPASGRGHCAARMFAPAIGVPEDIANANSTACLAAHLRATAGSEGIAVDMGDWLGRPATITATIVDPATGLVSVGGDAKVGPPAPLR